MDFFKSLFNKPNYKDRIPSRVYRALDWKRTLVGGSYALQQYTGDHWQPNDIDIMIKCENKEEYDKIIREFSIQMQADVIKLLKGWYHDDDLYEKINESVIGTTSFRIPEMSTKIQLVGIDTGKKSLINKMDEIVDKPACLAYSMENGVKTFHGSAECFRAVNTRKVPKTPKQLVSRMEKYKARGFTFE